MRKELTIALAGNPNCGKTTIFNNLTGARQKVGNWPGVTIEKKEGYRKYNAMDLRIVDLPGTYSLTPFSIEEITARDFIVHESPDIVLDIIDASNLERSLFLALQIMELGCPVLFVLNMADMAEVKGIRIDEKKLSALLGVPVVFTVGNRNRGMDALMDQAIAEVAAFKKGKVRRVLRYGPALEACISRITGVIGPAYDRPENPLIRWHAIKLLEEDSPVREMVLQRLPEQASKILSELEACRERIEKEFQDAFDFVLTEDRYGIIAGLLKETVTHTAHKRIDLSRNIDLVLTNRVLGIPVFIFFIWAMFQMTFRLGEIPMGWIESGVGMLADTLDGLLADSLWKSLLLDGVIAGIGSVIIFLPNILILFFCIALFEDTGYMARAAFLMDRVMHTAGLHGKSFIPMLMGFGCNVPAIMAARSLEHQKDRIMTILMTPFMSCSARLPVYIVLAGTFFAENAGTVIFSLYLGGIIMAILSGRILKRLFFKGQDAPFVMELPPYRMPMLKSLIIHMWDRSRMFLRKMGGVILVGSVIIWVLSTFPLSGPYSQNDTTGDMSRVLTEQERVAGSYIGRIGQALEPVFSPIGIGWQAGVALVTGFVAKEVVVSTMGVLFGAGRDGDQALSAALKESGMTALSALSMMVFVLMYVPCFATVAAIYREASPGWAIFNIVYTTVVAWTLSFLVYQGGKLFSG